VKLRLGGRFAEKWEEIQEESKVSVNIQLLNIQWVNTNEIYQ